MTGITVQGKNVHVLVKKKKKLRRLCKGRFDNVQVYRIMAVSSTLPFYMTVGLQKSRKPTGGAGPERRPGHRLRWVFMGVLSCRDVSVK